MKFLVDIGNSRIKWAQYRHNSLRSCDACAYDKGHLIGSIDPYWRELSRPTQVFVSNVAGDALATEISAYVDKIWSMTPIYLLVDKEAAGVINGYDDSSQLGIDRWLAMIAARASYQSALCIVDCGTALTVDVITASGQHKGGYIVPGLKLMSDALNSRTQQINSTISRNPSLKLGLNTESCINNGAFTAIVALIESVFSELVREHGKDSRCIITGGYAEEIRSVLPFDVDSDPHLVLNGMVRLIEYL